jgi:hypothetical protein
VNTVTQKFTGPLSLKLIEQAYFSISFGYTEPDTIKCSTTLKPQLQFDKFNNATVQIDDSLDDHTVVICYSVPPMIFKQHRCVYQAQVTLEAAR